MERLTDQDAFTARELHARGFRAERIADLLFVDADQVEAALRGETAQPNYAQVAAPARPTPPAPPPVDANAWPPPVDAATEWAEVQVPRGYGLGAEVVRVRWVQLWGKRVRINAAAEVWCHYCLRFHTTKALSHPFSGCPVGLPYRGGIVQYGPNDEMPEPPEQQRQPWEWLW